MIGDLAKRLSDPTVTWRVARSFGGWVVKRPVTSTEPQVLSVCDEIVCVPVRFSEYFYWSDGQGNPAYRIFPNHRETWDHVNETNPSYAGTYEGLMYGIVGYSGYFIRVELTDGSDETAVHIVKRSYPELQVLVINRGTLAVRVSYPPAVHGLSALTNGTRGDGYADIGQNQYVVFYRSQPPEVDTTNGVFHVSPLGSVKTWDYEVYTRDIYWRAQLGFNLYLGIRAPRDMYVHTALRTDLDGGYSDLEEINESGLKMGFPTPFLALPESLQYYTTWETKSIPYQVSVGWAEDDTGSVRFAFVYSNTYRINLKHEERGSIDIFLLYDADLDEFFRVVSIKPVQDFWVQDIYLWEICSMFLYGTVARVVMPDGTLYEYTSGYRILGTYNASACYGNYMNVCLSAAVLGVYTDDPDVTIPDDPSSVFGFTQEGGDICYMWLNPFDNRTLKAGKTYAIVSRHKLFPTTVTGDEYKAWALRRKPYRVSDTEWRTLLGVLPLTVKLRGIRSGTVSVYVEPPFAPPGGTVDVYGHAAGLPNKLVRVVLVDPDTYSVLASTVTATNDYGNYIAKLTLPTDLTPGKTYRIYVLVEY